ncbi:MAG: bacterioferritin [Candidatus Melainabacteria bacterium]|nr:bacterioferritin [Candidatus Melainabacteria bacterium]
MKNNGAVKKSDEQSKSSEGDAFSANLTEIRRRAREHTHGSSVRAGYDGNRRQIVKILNEALATELVCALRYKRHHYMGKGIHSESVVKEFGEHAREELAHADRIAERIVQLNGEPNFDPEGLAGRSNAEYVACDTLTEMIKENLVAERIAVDIYREMIKYVGDSDPTTRCLLESILATEESHLEDMANFMTKY